MIGLNLGFKLVFGFGPELVGPFTTLDGVTAYELVFRSYNLCLIEKLVILLADEHTVLRPTKDHSLRENAGTKANTSRKTFDYSFNLILYFLTDF